MLPPRWSPAPPHPARLRALRQPGSLTARLALTGCVSVDVLASGWQAARPDEAAALGLARAGLRIYARLVCVRRNGEPVVLARSVTTAAGILGPWKGLRHLGRRPLASLLWTDPLIRRSPFEYARLPAADPLAHVAGVDRALPARRSRFWRNQEPLIVLEAFVGLPWPGVGWLSRRRRWAAHGDPINRGRQRP